MTELFRLLLAYIDARNNEHGAVDPARSGRDLRIEAWRALEKAADEYERRIEELELYAQEHKAVVLFERAPYDQMRPR